MSVFVSSRTTKGSVLLLISKIPNSPFTKEFIFIFMWRHPRNSRNQQHRLMGRKYNGVVVLLSVVLIITIIIASSVLLSFKNNENPFSLSNTSRSSLQLDPSTTHMNQTDVIWQIPDYPKAVLFIAHGCNGRAHNFWDRSPKCSDCVGLPEERRVTLQALQWSYAVLAISSVGRCWSLGKEVEKVKGIIAWWVKQHKLEKIPIVALGASSGGYFVSSLATEMRFSSITLMIAEGVFETMSVPPDYPPTLFVHMPKDRAMATKIQKNIVSLEEKGIPVKEIRCMEFPLTPYLLSDRIPDLDPRFSVKLFELFHANGFIDDRGYMRKDGRATPWKQTIKDLESSLGRYDMVNHIQEEMNLAFAYHEMTSLEMGNILKWYEHHLN